MLSHPDTDSAIKHSPPNSKSYSNDSGNINITQYIFRDAPRAEAGWNTSL
jgi:hypothetical protein